MTLLCLIFGHRWGSGYIDEGLCPLPYFQCRRCEWVRHYCNEIDWSKVALAQKDSPDV